MLPNDWVFSSLTWFLPDSGRDSKQDKRDWGSIKLIRRRKSWSGSQGRVQKSQVKHWKTVDWAKRWGIRSKWSVRRGGKVCLCLKNIKWKCLLTYVCAIYIQWSIQNSVLFFPALSGHKRHSKAFGSSLPFHIVPYLILIDHKMTTSLPFLVCFGI